MKIIITKMLSGNRSFSRRGALLPVKPGVFSSSLSPGFHIQHGSWTGILTLRDSHPSPLKFD